MDGARSDQGRSVKCSVQVVKWGHCARHVCFADFFELVSHSSLTLCRVPHGCGTCGSASALLHPGTGADWSHVPGLPKRAPGRW